ISVALAGAVLIAVGWRAASPTVQHASVNLGHVGPRGLPLVVDVWRDPSSSQLVFRIRGDSDRSILRRRTLYDVTAGSLSDTTVYLRARDAWAVIQARFGLT